MKKKKKNWVCKVTEKKNWVDKMAKCYELLRAVLAINYNTQTERDLVCVLTFIDRKELICEELIYPKKELVCVLLFTGKMSFQIRSK